jgi:hypothetical protein
MFDQKNKSFEINNKLMKLGGDWHGILSVYKEKHQDFNHVNWSSAVSKLSRVDKKAMERVKASNAYRAFIGDLVEQLTAAPKLGDFRDPRRVASIVHSLAELRVNPRQIAGFLDAVNSDAEWLVENSSPQNVATMARAFAFLRTPAPALFKQIDKRSANLVKKGTPRNVAMVAGAFASLKFRGRTLFDNIAAHSPALVENGTRNTIKNTASAMRILHLPVPYQFEVSLNAKPPPISYEVSAASTSHCRINERLMEAGDDWQGVLAVWAEESEAFDDVNWATAVSKLRKSAPDDIAALKRSEQFGVFVRNLSLKMTASPALRDFGSVRAVGGILQCLAKLDVDVELIEGILKAVNTKENSDWIVQEGNALDIANTAWALAELDTPAPTLFKKIDDCYEKFLKAGGKRDIFVTIKAFTKLNAPSPNLTSQVVIVKK